MSKWGELNKYLNSVEAKPEAVLKMVKAAYGKKGRVSPTRVAWKLNVIVSIMNQKDKSTDSKIRSLVMKKNKVYRFAYNAFHTDKYSDKTEQQHFNACKKVWNTNKPIRTKLSKLSKLQRMKLQRSPAALADFLN
tara:strand:- start:103 stop:507 length:405 start_codon:yes stop_codon:yes gene_type:complete